MPALALKVLRVLLEYGALFWIAYVVVRLGQNMFHTLRTDLREAARVPEPSETAASFVAIAGDGLTMTSCLQIVLYRIIMYASIRGTMRISWRIWAAATTPI